MKTILFKPFEVYSEKRLLVVGIGFTILGTLLGFWFNTLFYGVVNTKPLQGLWFLPLFFDNLIVIFLLTLCLFLVGKYVNKKTRFVDMLTTTMISRAPIYLLAFANINGFLFHKSEKLKAQLPSILNGQNGEQILNDNLLFILVIGFISIVFLIWSIALLYNGFKIASNAKGTKGIILFTVAFIVAEVVSRIFISHLNKFVS